MLFRSSVNFGPLRVNFSRSGVGYSVGAGGFRTGVRLDDKTLTFAVAMGRVVGAYEAARDNLPPAP